MYLPNIIALLAGGFISWLLCEAFKKIFNLVRFGKLYTLLFLCFITLLPCIAYVYIFPYSGVLSGMTYIFTMIASCFGFTGYLIIFFICLSLKVAVKNRFIYCLISFYVAGIFILLHVLDKLYAPTIG